LLAGILVFGASSVAAEPFEQDTIAELYNAIALNRTAFITVNLLAAIGYFAVAYAMILLGRLAPSTQRRLPMAGTYLLAAASFLWLVEIIGRLTVTTTAAQQVASGALPPAGFPSNLGAGMDPLFVAFLGISLLGFASLFWQFDRPPLLSTALSRIGAVSFFALGVLAALTYPFAGVVERALFYPFVLVLLPMAISLLVRRASPSPALNRSGT